MLLIVLSEAEEAGFARPCACLTHWIYRWIVPEAVLSHIRSCTAYKGYPGTDTAQQTDYGLN